MKTIIFSFCVMALMAFIPSGKTSENPGSAQISFEKDMHDFGTMKQGSDVSFKYIFTNTGDAPLIISDVKKSCGCTSPSWSKEPIAPGKSGFVVLAYDSKRVGPFNKSVVVSSNSAENPEFTLRFKGTIEVVEGNGAPVKNTENLLIEK